MANSQLQKVETVVHIKASADKFYDLTCNSTHYIADIYPEKVLSIEIHEEGKTCLAKEVVEGFDRENNKRPPPPIFSHLVVTRPVASVTPLCPQVGLGLGSASKAEVGIHPDRG
ncbi:hypothetical protein Fmac_018378 [Flemingia macrophylla]|uniref:Bet v I/Major latex protein domain-containing protein n=1 Tax=Flemingia macrophylla TaxID=520843 RepID=A0ABD1M576_9FABA